MKIYKYIMLVLFLALATGIDNAWAQRRGGMQKNKQMYSRNYDTNTVETIQGEIAEVVYQQSKKRPGMNGVHLIVKKEDGTIPVHVGPVWYMNQQEVSFEKGDQISVTGSRITFDNAPAIIAASIKRGDMTLQLRDQNGFPRWRGWKRSTQ